MKAKHANAVLFIGLLLLASFSFGVGYFLAPGKEVVTTRAVHIRAKDLEASATVPIAAVYSAGDDGERGIMGQVTVEVGDGDGDIMVNINNILTKTDTQKSAKLAVAAAEKHLGEDFADEDIVFTISADAGIISGPSAGAAMASALILAMEEKEVNDKVAITGALSPNETGEIIGVAGLLAKAEAVEAAGYDVFLVPSGQSEYEDCTKSKGFERCKTINVGKQIGIDVVEVSTVGEAAEYFYSEPLA